MIPGNDAVIDRLIAESRVILGRHMTLLAESELFAAVEEFYKVRRAGFSVLTAPTPEYFSTELAGSLYWLRISYCMIALFNTDQTAEERPDQRIASLSLLFDSCDDVGVVAHFVTS